MMDLIETGGTMAARRLITLPSIPGRRLASGPVVLDSYSTTETIIRKRSV